LAEFNKFGTCKIEKEKGIPNIKDILERLGEQKSGFFCKLDLTAGFHQMLIRKRVESSQLSKPPGAVCMSGADYLWD